MKVSNEVYKVVTIDWANVTLPLKEGSPVSLAGVVSNDEDAFGIVPQNYFAEPLEKSIYVLVGGHVDLDEIETLFGDSYDDAAIEALNGIHFYKDGVAIPTGGSDGSDGSGGTVVVGEVFQDEETLLDVTWVEIFEAMESGKIVMLVGTADTDDGVYVRQAFATAAVASEGVFFVYFGENMYGTDSPEGYPIFEYNPEDGGAEPT